MHFGSLACPLTISLVRAFTAKGSKQEVLRRSSSDSAPASIVVIVAIPAAARPVSAYSLAARLLRGGDIVQQESDRRSE